jgi:hypothetical protein
MRNMVHDLCLAYMAIRAARAGVRAESRVAEERAALAAARVAALSDKELLRYCSCWGTAQLKKEARRRGLLA